MQGPRVTPDDTQQTDPDGSVLTPIRATLVMLRNPCDPRVWIWSQSGLPDHCAISTALIMVECMKFYQHRSHPQQHSEW